MKTLNNLILFAALILSIAAAEAKPRITGGNLPPLERPRITGGPLKPSIEEPVRVQCRPMWISRFCWIR